MTAPDGYGTLEAGLLARKGRARPAMRPHGTGLDDLGWNDLTGGGPRPTRRRSITFANADEPGKPAVLLQQEAIEREFADAAPIKRRAFTLRLDPALHLRFRTACVASGASGQHLLTQALERLLAAPMDDHEGAGR